MTERPFLTFVVVVATAYVGYNAVLHWRRDANFNTVAFQETKESIGQKLGPVVARFPCISTGSDAPAEAVNFCQEQTVLEVSQYRSCGIARMCRSLVLVAYDKNGKMVYKYRSDSGVF